MKSRLLVGFAFCVVLGQFVALARDESGPAAIVSELQGSATVKEPDKAQRALEIYDWVGERASITVSKGSRVVLVLTSGARFALKERARVTVLRAGLPASADVEPLPSFPPLPVVAPIASAAVPPISAATRVRGFSIRNLYPSGHTTLADGTTLRFDGPRGVEYLVTIEDQTGAPVWRQEIESGAVTVPPDVLAPERRYRWRVAAIGKSEPALSAGGAFVTVSAAAARARITLRSTLPAADLSSVILLARVDEQLGLLREARESLATAAAKAPEDESIQRMLARIEKRF